MLDLTQPLAIRDARRALGLTQSQLAAALELEGRFAKDTVRSWETGKRPISGPARVAIRLMLEAAGLAKRAKAAPLPPGELRAPWGSKRDEAAGGEA